MARQESPALLIKPELEIREFRVESSKVQRLE
jgi:hypothetical protein